MADVTPFHGFRFCVERLSNAQLARFVADPYVGIESDARIGQPPITPVDLDAPGVSIGDTGRHYPSSQVQDNLYAPTRHKILDWLQTRYLNVESAPMLYVYHQTFEDPQGEQLVRRGLIGRVGLADYAEQIILPHERTLSGPKLDRMELMQATEANLNQVFMLYQDVEHVIDRKLEGVTESTRPLLELTTFDGIHHQLWGVCDEVLIGEVSTFFSSQRLLIADGHHRYETALAYRALRRQREPEDPTPAPYDHVMTLLVNAHDPGLLVLPTHRVVHSVPGFEMGELIGALDASLWFEVTPLDRELLLDAPELRRVCARAGASRPSFIFISPDHDHPVLVEFKGDARAEIFDEDTPDEVRALDVTVLHEGVLDRMLGIDKRAQAAMTNLRYSKRLEDAMAELTVPTTQLLVLMNATPVSQINEVCQSGGLMPQKSTYFYPKILSSLMLSPLS